MLKAEVIESPISEWVAQVIFAANKCWTLRFCIDYRRLNQMTIRESYPIPRIDECIDSIGTVCVLITLECSSDTGKSKYPKKTDKKPDF